MFEKINVKLNTKLKNYLNSRFGFSKEYFEKYDFYKNRKKIFIISKLESNNNNNNNSNNINSNRKDVIEKIIKNNKIESLGLELFVNYKEYLLSSLSVSLFEKNEIKTNYVELDRSQTKDYFKGKVINIKDISENKRNILSYGQIIAIYNNKIIGLFDYNKEKELIPNIVFENENIK